VLDSFIIIELYLCCGVIVNALNAVEHGSSNMSSQTKDYNIGISYFPLKHTALRSNNKDWLAQN